MNRFGSRSGNTRGLAAAGVAAALGLLSVRAAAEVDPARTWHTLVSSNGHGAVVVNLLPPAGSAPIHHFREHLFATEEPQIDAVGSDVFVGGKPQSVFARDLLYDAYFGVRANAGQGWLKTVPVDLGASGFEGTVAGATGGTGIVRLAQTSFEIETTQYVFAPWGLEHAGFCMIARVKNVSGVPLGNASVFSLHNFHLGFGRPGPQLETGEENETIVYHAAKDAFEERGFAGAVVTRSLVPSSHHGASNAATPPAQNVWQIVESGGTKDIPDLNGAAPTATGSVSAFQTDLGPMAIGQEAWVGVVSAHHGDPFAAATIEGWLDAWVAGRTPQKILEDERAAWASFQAAVQVPPGSTPEQEALVRQSAVVLRMAQVRERSSYLRNVLTNDATVRRTRFGAKLGDPPATLPATVEHRGAGAMLASLPPGEWTYAWPRDGAYAVVGMAAVGMKAEARAALEFGLSAEGGRFQGYNELAGYGMPPYRISLVRYHGFGVEETDYNDHGPNLEFDGFGLQLWALRAYEQITGDTSLRSARFGEMSTKIADVLVALIDPATGLIRPDSSIWETHWNGRQRVWTYTNIAAVRGLCDAAQMAQAEGQAALASKYQGAAEGLRNAIAAKLTDGSRALVSNAEELASGEGYTDAAVLDAIAFGLFAPAGPIAKATLARVAAGLATQAGVGWARNDDAWDHPGKTDLSPWGSEYDSAEWVFTDMRGAVALRLAGDTAKSDKLVEWVRRQAAVNYLEIAETYDPTTGAYKFNAPMVGFGAGAWIVALAHARGALAVDPACGAYFPEPGQDGGAPDGGDAGADAAGEGAADVAVDPAADTGAEGVVPADSQVPEGSAEGSVPDAGSAGASGAGQAGASSVPVTVVPAETAGDSGCGCRAAAARGAGGPWGLLLAGAALAGRVWARGARAPRAPRRGSTSPPGSSTSARARARSVPRLEPS
jgi:GH15 family glucan-1,4-alpha-glucosidase